MLLSTSKSKELKTKKQILLTEKSNNFAYKGVSNRFRAFCEIKELRQVDIADYGIASKQYITNIWNNKNEPNTEFCARLLMIFPDLRWEWLLAGQEPMLRNEEITDTENKNKYYQECCEKCLSREREIEALNKALEAKEELLQMYRSKKENLSSDCA